MRTSRTNYSRCTRACAGGLLDKEVKKEGGSSSSSSNTQLHILIGAKPVCSFNVYEGAPMPHVIHGAVASVKRLSGYHLPLPSSSSSSSSLLSEAPNFTRYSFSLHSISEPPELLDLPIYFVGRLTD